MDLDIEESFGRIWPKHVASLTDFLIDCRSALDGDLDLLLILCVIGERTFSAKPIHEGVRYADWEATKVSIAVPEEINMQSISDFCGIPRETVRRKLQCLIDRGWVTRNQRGFLIGTVKAKDDLAPLTVAGLRYLERMFALMKREEAARAPERRAYAGRAARVSAA